MKKNQAEIIITEGLRDPNAHSVKLQGIDTLGKLNTVLSHDQNVQSATFQELAGIVGYEALSRTVVYKTGPGTKIEETYILDGKGKVIIITHNGDTSSSRDIFSQILSTFRFL